MRVRGRVRVRKGQGEVGAGKRQGQGEVGAVKKQDRGAGEPLAIAAVVTVCRMRLMRCGQRHGWAAGKGEEGVGGGVEGACVRCVHACECEAENILSAVEDFCTLNASMPDIKDVQVATIGPYE